MNPPRPITTTWLPPSGEPDAVANEPGRTIVKARSFRWIICTLLLLGVTKNYMDRQVLGVLKTTLQHEFGWTEIDYGNLVFAFQADRPTLWAWLRWVE
jgi:ACS family hexuronate transporter-like MFS transporter